MPNHHDMQRLYNKLKLKAQTNFKFGTIDFCCSSNENYEIMAQGKTLHQLLVKMVVNKFEDHSALYPFNCLSVRVLCIVTAQGSAWC